MKQALSVQAAPADLQALETIAAHLRQQQPGGWVTLASTLRAALHMTADSIRTGRAGPVPSSALLRGLRG